MADDLKTELMKVLQNKGKKRFFFDYGTGKRTDSNGDGHLIVGPFGKATVPVVDNPNSAARRIWSGSGRRVESSG